jgi:hypothetical protein
MIIMMMMGVYRQARYTRGTSQREVEAGPQPPMREREEPGLGGVAVVACSPVVTFAHTAVLFALFPCPFCSGICVSRSARGLHLLHWQHGVVQGANDERRRRPWPGRSLCGRAALVLPLCRVRHRGFNLLHIACHPLGCTRRWRAASQRRCVLRSPGAQPRCARHALSPRAAGPGPSGWKGVVC